MKKLYSIMLVAILLVTVLFTGCNGKDASAMASDGNTVKVHYTGTLADGTVFDTSAGREPLPFTLGAGMVIPGFEDAVRGMKIGQSKTVTIPAAEAYGPHLDELVLVIDRDKLAAGLNPVIGQQLPLTLTDGRVITVIVTAVSETTVTVDANHPMAGKDLAFEIELVEIE